MFPVIIKRGNASGGSVDAEVADAPIYFEITRDGIFEVRTTPIYRSVTRVHGGIPGLAPGRERLSLHAPKLPSRLVDDVIAFFAAINRICGGEGVVILFFDPVASRYRAEVPEQCLPVYRNYQGDWITDLSVTYDRVDRPEGYLRCGSIHSHADLPAYASHTDCADEKYEDGLHMVVGDFGHQHLTLSASYTVAGSRFAVAVPEVSEPFDRSGYVDRPCAAEWLEKVALEFTLNGRLSRVSLPTLAARSGGSAARGGRLSVSLEDIYDQSHSYH